MCVKPDLTLRGKQFEDHDNCYIKTLSAVVLDESYKEESRCMKLVLCNTFHPNKFLLINPQEKFGVFKAVKMAILFL
jgi:hypothetical protein